MGSSVAGAVGLAAAREGLAAMRDRLWIIVLAAIVGCAVGLATGGEDDTSEAYATLLAKPLGSNSGFTGLGVSTPVGPLAADFVTDEIISDVARATGEDFHYLLTRLMISQDPVSSPVTGPPIGLVVQVGPGGRAEAEELLAAWLDAIRRARSAFVREQTKAALDAVRTEAEKAADAGARQVAREARFRALVLDATRQRDFVVIRGPRYQTLSGQSPLRDGAKGLAAGIAIGLLLALSAALLDGRIRTPAGIAAAFGAPLVGDLRPDGDPPAGFAREWAQARAAGGGGGGGPGVLLAVGDADARAAVDRLGDGAPLVAADGLQGPGTLARLAEAPVYLVLARPGGVTRAEASALVAQLKDIAGPPAGVLVV